MPLACSAPDLTGGHLVRDVASLDPVAWFADACGAASYVRAASRRGLSASPAPDGTAVPDHGWSVVDCHLPEGPCGRPVLVRRSWYAHRPDHVDPGRLHHEAGPASTADVVAARVAAMAARERLVLASPCAPPAARDRALGALARFEAVLGSAPAPHAARAA